MTDQTLSSDIARIAAIEDRFRRAQEYGQDIGFLLARIGRLGRDHSRLHGVADAGRAFLRALERAEERERAKFRQSGGALSLTPDVPLNISVDSVRDELAALADAINDLDRTVNRRD